jgi:hypothetical protein
VDKAIKWPAWMLPALHVVDEDRIEIDGRQASDVLLNQA